MKLTSLKNNRFFNFIFSNFKDLKLLLFWPLFGAAFWFLEQNADRNWCVVESALDHHIPFCEYFVIPYIFWFLFIIIIHFYTFFCDRPSYVKYMRYTTLTYVITLIIYIFIPTIQHLRPDLSALGRDNVFVSFMSDFYKFDTNTNVCPSLHVTGSIGVWIAAWKSKHLSTPLWRTIFTVIALLIIASTVFLKQHSIIDVVASFILCSVVYVIIYTKKEKI